VGFNPSEAQLRDDSVQRSHIAVNKSSHKSSNKSGNEPSNKPAGNRSSSKPNSKPNKPHGKSGGKGPAAHKSSTKPSTQPPAKPHDDEAELPQQLCDLALDIAELEDAQSDDDTLRQKRGELNKLVKRAIFKKRDGLLYEAMLLAKDAELAALQILKERVEEAAEVVVTKGADGKNVEINVFMIPMFVSTTGGLHYDRCFQDQSAFEQLSASLQQAGLESEAAKVVLVHHVYHLDEIDALRYGQVHDMVREAHAAISDKRHAATPAIDGSFGPWPASPFGAEDHAVELRFLLGFAQKAIDDPFYRIPQDDAEMEAYFDARAERFECWAEQIQPVIKRCLAEPGAQIDVNFQYQDLLHGAKDRAMAEYDMLQLLSELRQGIDQHEVEPGTLKAIIGPVQADGNDYLRVQLLHIIDEADEKLLCSADKPCLFARDIEDEVADVQDGLASLGLQRCFVAQGFDGLGRPMQPTAL
jgi:hypothetical protein